MEGDFVLNKWHQLKQELIDRETTPFFQEGDVWFCSIGRNIGHEQNGKHELYERPVLVVKKVNNETFFGLPLSTKTGRTLRQSFFVHQNRTSFVLLSQMRLYDARRLQRKIFRIGILELHRCKQDFVDYFLFHPYKKSNPARDAGFSEPNGLVN